MTEPIDILLVDDSPTHLAVLEDILVEQGYRVETAGDGIEAIDIIRQNPPRLVLSDVLMPRLNGYHLCRLLKNDAATAALPIILLTNLNERHDRFWGEHAGADLFLPKEIAPNELLAAVKTRLDSSHRITSPSSASINDNVHDRINQILDRLLYDSTISNRILELTGLTHDPPRLAAEFIQLLAMLCHFEAALLILPTDRESFNLYIHRATTEPDTQDYYQHVKDVIPEVPAFQDLSHAIDLDDSAGPTNGSIGSLQLAHHAAFHVNGKLVGAFAFFRDNALSDRAQHALNVVSERFQVVIRYLVTLNEIEEMKGDFVSMLVHDLRSPLTSIKGFNDVLASGTLGPISSDQQQACDSIQENSDRMLVLIEDLLELSKLERGKLKIHPGPVDLHHLAATACRILQPQFDANEQKITIDFQTELRHVIADGKQIGRVFSNLLSNAIKFTPEGGHIRIETIVEDAPDQRYFRVKVTDDGIGIPEDQQEQLFERYLQLPSSGLFSRGTGLGLAICKEIIQLHGGKIKVTSPVNADGGSCFSFTLPIFE